MSKLGVAIIPGIIIVVALVTLVSLPSEEIDDLGPITIVANLPITGPGSGIGVEDRDGLQLSIEKINAAGGINDRNIELVIIDNETNLDKAKEIFLESEQTYKPLLHISALSFITTGIGQLAEESEVILIALSAVAPEVTQDREWVFRYFPMAYDEGVPILQTLKKLNVNNLGILYLNDEFGRSIANEVGTQFENSGKIVSQESILHLLQKKPMRNKEICEKLEAKSNRISYHLQKLLDLGKIEKNDDVYSFVKVSPSKLNRLIFTILEENKCGKKSLKEIFEKIKESSNDFNSWNPTGQIAEGLVYRRVDGLVARAEYLELLPEYCTIDMSPNNVLH